MTGILVLNKEQNCTSFLAVNRVRRFTGEKKCGHTGTLDPMATGVLPIALGGATRFIELLPDHTKKYYAEFRLGLRSDTLDIWGNITEETGKTAALSEIEALLSDFTGDIMQIPPMYSARRVDGVRLYDLARKGTVVSRDAKGCTVHSLKAASLPNGDFSLLIECSAGTYVRTLIDDLGNSLGCGAVMTALNRTEACGFSIDSAHTLLSLEQAAENGSVGEMIVPLENALKSYPGINVTPAQGIRFKNGGELSRERLNDSAADKIDGLCRVYSDGCFLGLGSLNAGGESLTVKRIFSER